MKLHTATLEDARNARRARPQIGKRIPQPVDDQDLITAVAAAPGKLRPADDTPAKIRARLAAELTKAKAAREAGRPPGRDKPAAGGKTKAGR